MSNATDFKIKNGTLIKYLGNDSEVIIPEGVTRIGNNAFSCHNNLTRVYIPNSVTSIKENAFSWCKNLTSLNIPDSVTDIGKEALLGCESLAEAVIPIGVTAIRGGFGCKSIRADKNDRRFTDIDGNLYTYDKSSLIAYAGGKKDVFFAVPQGVKTIETDAFRFCTNLTSIIIPESVTTVNSYAFSNCTNLRSIIFEGCFPQTGAGIFCGCGNLNTLVIHNSGSDEIASPLFDCDSLKYLICSREQASLFKCPVDDEECDDAFDSHNYTDDEDVTYVDCESRSLAYAWENGDISDWYETIKKYPCHCLKVIKNDVGFYKLVINMNCLDADSVDRAIAFTDSLECRAILLEYKRTL